MLNASITAAMSVAALSIAGCAPAPNAGNDTASVAASVDDAASADNSIAEPARPDPVATPGPAPSAGEPPANATAATSGGDGSAIALAKLTPTDVQRANLSGELACSFGDGASGTLLLARGDVASKERAQGVVKIGDYVEPIGTPGGYDAMAKGTRFDGKGKTIRIAVTGAPRGGGESPGRPATLTYQRADGAERTLQGDWTCGP